MDMNARNQYLKELINKTGYHHLKKKEKQTLLDEYCKNTGQNRKYVITKIRDGTYLESRQAKVTGKKRARSSYYDTFVVTALAHLWHIFDQPCGQRLQPLLTDETDRLRQQGELVCSDEVAGKLKKISARSIDDKLKHEKEVVRLKQKYAAHRNPLLYQKIPTKLPGEWDRSEPGNIQVDLVEHCGQSTFGPFANTLSTTDISFGWWEGEAIPNQGQYAVVEGLDEARSRYPFTWKEIHPDNGAGFINDHLYRYTGREKLGFSRSRPNKKNDNCFIEQKNSTHVRRTVGHLRYDTEEEQSIINDLYHHELRLYKNFFQPVIKLIDKERIKGKVMRKYDTAKTPYKRIMESHVINQEIKDEITANYDTLNPAELKRNIDRKVNHLYDVYKKKHEDAEPNTEKRLIPRTVKTRVGLEN